MRIYIDKNIQEKLIELRIDLNESFQDTIRRIIDAERPTQVTVQKQRDWRRMKVNESTTLITDFRGACKIIGDVQKNEARHNRGFHRELVIDEINDIYTTTITRVK